ncbi:MAG: hypothetical protein H7175_01385 [Burkholderiales bacterium]|nr:hypothetical protein [Anaerolineae bacterium]
MSDILLPALKDARWPSSTMVVCRQLAPELDSPHIPYVAFGYDRPHTFEFLNREGLPDLGRTAEEIERIAVNNLLQRPAEWQHYGSKDDIEMLLWDGDYFAAEHILNADFMRDAQLILEAYILAVGIPRRGLLLVTNGVQPPEKLRAFGAVVSAQFYRAESAPISPVVFGVKDGQIVGMLSGGEEAGRQIAAEQAQQENKNLYISGSVLTDDDSGLQTVEIVAGSPDINLLSQAILGAFKQALNDFHSREDFSGVVRFVLIPAMTPDSPALRQSMASLTNHLNGIAAEIARITDAKHTVAVQIVYGDEAAESE